jgi:hypothetical protein
LPQPNWHAVWVNWVPAVLHTVSVLPTQLVPGLQARQAVPLAAQPSAQVTWSAKPVPVVLQRRSRLFVHVVAFGVQIWFTTQVPFVQDWPARHA